MPHFVIDCSTNAIARECAEAIIREVHDTAESTGLFKPPDIKVRIRRYDDFTVGNTNADFVHVFAYIMQGRTTEQRADLSKRIVAKLAELLPHVPVISMNVSEFERATYCNRKML